MKIFISYAHVDESQVRELVEILRDAHHDPWFDHRLKAGRVWEDQLLQAIKDCNCFLYALTPESTASEWCQWEFSQAVHVGKPILPVRMQANVIFNGALTVLNRIQYVDFSQGITGRATARLFGGLSDAEAIPPDQVPLLLSPSTKTVPERPTDEKSGSRALVQQLFDEAYTLYRNKHYHEAQELLEDCLVVDKDYADAQKLLDLVKWKIDNSTISASPKPQSRQLLSKVQQYWSEVKVDRVNVISDQANGNDKVLVQASVHLGWLEPEDVAANLVKRLLFPSPRLRGRRVDERSEDGLRAF